MRVTGIILLVLGAVLFGLSFLLLGENDMNALYGSLLMGIGGAGVVASLPFLFGKKPRTA